LANGKTVFRDFRVSKGPGLGEPLGEASSANTAFGWSRWVPMTSRNSQAAQGGYPPPSEAWPYEALEKRLPRPIGEKKEKLGVGKF